MNTSNNLKIKLLKLLEILQQETDEEHPLSTKQLIARLDEQGVTVERKTLYEDIKLLQDSGYEIMCVREQTNKYYVEDRKFNVAELRVLIDCLQSAKFMTKKKTAELTLKIANLAGANRAKLLKQNIVKFDTVKHTNEVIYYNIDALDRAILSEKQVSFRYFDYNAKGGKTYRKEGRRYLESPLALIFAEDYYYLVAYSEKYEGVVHYRVDRMNDVEIEDSLISESAKKKKKDMSYYKNELFDMYGGKKEVVEFLADQSIIDSVTDKFGEKLCMYESEQNGKVTFKANVRIAPTFYAWVTTFGEKLVILGSQETIDGYKRFLQEAGSNYKD